MIFGESPAEQGTGALPIVLPFSDLTTTLATATPASGTSIYNSCTHPDVAYIPQGFGDASHRYWMAVTGYPDVNREIPNVFASYDGVTWVTPDGATNPVVARAEAIAALGASSYLADPDIVFVPPNLILFYMRFNPSLDWQLVRRTSVNGRKWSDPVVTVSGATPPMISPAIVWEGGNNMTVFYVKGTAGGTPTIQYRTSTDLGVTWSTEQNTSITKCTDNRPDFWHMDVIKVSGKYHALILSKVSSEPYLWYYTSTDKINWNQESHTPAIPYSGNPTFDGLGNYRSTLVAKESGLFDIWVTGQPRGATADDVSYWPDLAVTANSGTDFFTSTAGAHYLNNNDEVTFGGTGATMPGGVTAGTTYYVKARTNTTFQISTTKGGANVDLTSNGSSIRASRNPWRIGLYRNVSLPMKPNLIAPYSAVTNVNPGGGCIIPPANCINAALAAWPTANLGFAQRFTVETPIELRYARYPCSAAGVGNIEVGVLRMTGSDRSLVSPLITSGVIAAPAPTAGTCRVDLGRFVLMPGEYWLWFWSDSNAGPTVPAAAIGYGGTYNVAQSSLAAGGGKAMPTTGATLDMTGGRAVSHFMLEGDYS